MKTEVKTESSRIHSLISGVLVGYAITCIIFLAYSMLITYTPLTEENMPLVLAIAALISVIVAGFDSARGAENKGWFWGIMAGLIYALILVFIMTLIRKEFFFTFETGLVMLICLAGGGLGGVVGINLKN